jgi:HTH-type transcriptional regulator / antitoxin HigA
MERLNMKMTTKTARGRESVRDDYLELVRAFPLRQIRTAKEHAAAMKVLSPLMARSTMIPSDLSDGELDYLGAIGVLIHAYEAPIRERLIANVTPVDRIRHYMENRNMKAKDLAPHVGGKASASLLLSGRRQVSREQAKTLAALFNTDAGKFL